VTHLQRYPEARRAVLALGGAPMWLVVWAPGEGEAPRPAAFLVPSGQGVVLDAGVWHAGPVPLCDASLCEMLEVTGPADRFDRRSLGDLVDAEAVRVLLPEDPASPVPMLDLGAPNAVLLDASLHGRLRLGCLLLAEPDLAAERPALEEELALAAEGLRAMWRHVTDVAQIPGIALGRELYRAAGVDPGRHVPRSEALVTDVLAGGVPACDGVLDRALTLCALRTRVPLGAYDAARLGSPVLLRTGTDEDGRPACGGRPTAVEGRPVVCARDDRVAGSLLGEADAFRPGPGSRAVLVVLYVPPSVEDAALEALLDGVARTLETHTAGGIAGRLLVG
jgi:DNA/RNA-binding domain of Phe-tRNA-synthetase-like protein